MNTLGSRKFTATMPTSFRVLAPASVTRRQTKTGKDVILEGPSFTANQASVIFLVVYLAALSLAVTNVAEDVLGWSIAALWLFLVTALIYTPDMIRVELVVWSCLAVHLIMQVIHAASVGTNTWVAAFAAFVNAFAELTGSVTLSFVGFSLMIAQVSMPGSSNFTIVSIVFAGILLLNNLRKTISKQ